MNQLAFPVPARAIIALVLGITLFTLLHSLELMRWAYADWPATSAEARQSLTLSGPWAAGCAAFVSSRFSSPISLLCSAAASRSGLVFVWAQIRVLAIWSLLSFTAGLMPVLVYTSSRATYGGPSIAVILSGVAVLWAFVALGYTTGLVVPGNLGPPVAAVVAFSMVIFPDFFGPAVSPVWAQGVIAGQHETLIVSLFRIVFFLGFAAGFVIMSGHWLLTRSVPMRFSSGFSLVGLVIPVLVGFTAAREAPDAIRADSPPAAICSQSSLVEVCVHASRSAMLPELSGAAERVFSILGPARPMRYRISDATLALLGQSADLTLQLQGNDKERWLSAATQDMAIAFSGFAQCSGQYDAAYSDVQLGAIAVSGGVAIWIARQAKTTSELITNAPDAVAVADRLERTSTAKVQNFLIEAGADLRNCAASNPFDK